MKINRLLRLTLLIASIALLAISIGPLSSGSASALPPVQSSATIPYSGSLTDKMSQPVADGTYAFIFTLYDAETGGKPLWMETQESVTVQGGAFVALLGSVSSIPRETLDGGERWLEVAVCGPDESSFTTLAPRQRLSAASPTAPTSPAAGLACPHDHWGENWAGTSGTGLTVRSSTGIGVVGVNIATGNYAELGLYDLGIHAVAFGAGHNAVYGQSTSGDGVRGDASVANKSGVYGYNSSSGYGVFGRSAAGYAGGFSSENDHLDLFLGGAIGRINASEQNDSQLYLSSNADVVVRLDNDGGGNHAFRIKNSGGSDVFIVDEAGNTWASGSKSAMVETATHGPRLLYAVESTEVWFEDLGSASLVDGEATVTFDPIFAETVNLKVDYHVFVTPLSQEPVLLFVTAKTAAGFTVRGATLDGESAQCSFDYRVVARRLGYEDVRLEAVERQEDER